MPKALGELRSPPSGLGRGGRAHRIPGAPVWSPRGARLSGSGGSVGGPGSRPLRTLRNGGHAGSQAPGQLSQRSPGANSGPASAAADGPRAGLGLRPLGAVTLRLPGVRCGSQSRGVNLRETAEETAGRAPSTGGVGAVFRIQRVFINPPAHA